MKPKLVIFDLWHTLVDFRFKLFTHILEMFGSHMPVTEFVKLIEASDIYVKDIPLEETLPAFLSQWSPTKEQVEAIMRMWKESTGEAHIYQFAEKYLKHLKNSGHKLALLSNFDRYGYDEFAFPELFDYFDLTFFSYKEGMAKPNPECWMRILNHFSVEPGEAVMIGNSLSQDIHPAQKLGMYAVQVTPEYGLGTVDFSEQPPF